MSPAPPYAQTNPDDLTLRDHLARDRTILANERTLLSYFRTGFGFAAGGVTLVKLFPDDLWLVYLGFALVGLGPLIAVFGVLRFVLISRRLREILKEPN